MRRTRNGKENAPGKRSWLRQSGKPSVTAASSCGLSVHTGIFVWTTAFSLDGTSIS